MEAQPLPPHPSSRNIPSCLLAIPGVEKITLERGRFYLQEDGGWMFERVYIYLHVMASPTNPFEDVVAALDAMPCCQKDMPADDSITLRLDPAGKVIIDGPCRLSTLVRAGPHAKAARAPGCGGNTAPQGRAPPPGPRKT